MDPLAKSEKDQYPYDYTEVKTLLAWTAPGRPFRQRGKTYYATSLLIMFFLEIILFLFGQYMLMLVIVSFVFVAFALASVPPKNFHYRISTEGVFIEDHFFLWSELYDFFFKEREGKQILHIRTRAFLPGELTLTLDPIDTTHVKAVILPYLPFREYMKPSFMDKAGEWISKMFPLDIVQPQK